MINTIVYVTFGGTKYHDQARFSVLSLLALLIAGGRDDYRILIYTDRPELAPAHARVRSIPLDPADLQRFRGPLDFVHRIRLEVFKLAHAEFGLPFIYVDCDTRWLQLPDAAFAALRAGEGAQRPPFIMWNDEGAIAGAYYPQYQELLARQRARFAGWGLARQEPWHMWNAGTLGIPAGGERVFDRIIAITDELQLHTPLRNFVDQLVISMVAAAEFTLHPMDDCLAHYWNFGTELPVLLRRFFDALPADASVEEQARRSAEFAITEADLRAIQQAPGSAFTRWRGKLRNSLAKRRIDLRAWWLRNRRAADRR